MKTPSRAHVEADTLDIWAAETAKHPGWQIVRVIFLEERRQEFKLIRPIPEREQETESVLDGSTIYVPTPPGGHSLDELLAIDHEYNELWKAAQR